MTDKPPPTSPAELEYSLSGSRPTAQRIVVRDFVCEATIGVTEAERSKPQRISLDIVLSLRVSPPLRDEVAETLNYGLVVRILRRYAGESRYSLLETLAEALAGAFLSFEEVNSTRIRILKLERYADVAGIGIEIERERARLA